MNLEKRIRALLCDKVSIRITSRRRGPFVVVRPDGLQTEHATRREAMQRLMAELRCMNRLTWQIAVLLREIPYEEISSAPAEEKIQKTPDAGASENRTDKESEP